MGFKQCNAKSKRTGEKCKARAVLGSTKCYHHGGKSLAGVASPTFKDGRYSKFIPKHLADGFDKFASDPKRLDLSENIALADTRISELLTTIDHGGTQEHWKQVNELLEVLEVAINRKLEEKALTTLTQIKEVCSSAIDDSKVWAEISTLGENRRKLAETEQKRLLSTDMMIQADRAYGLIALVQDIILRNVSDTRIRGAIANELRSILAPAVDQRTGSDPQLIEVAERT